MLRVPTAIRCLMNCYKILTVPCGVTRAVSATIPPNNKLWQYKQKKTKNKVARYNIPIPISWLLLYNPQVFLLPAFLVPSSTVQLCIVIWKKSLKINNKLPSPNSKISPYQFISKSVQSSVINRETSSTFRTKLQVLYRKWNSDSTNNIGSDIGQGQDEM